jgi:hypothetical protein
LLGGRPAPPPPPQCDVGRCIVTNKKLDLLFAHEVDWVVSISFRVCVPKFSSNGRPSEDAAKSFKIAGSSGLDFDRSLAH